MVVRTFPSQRGDENVQALVFRLEPFDLTLLCGAIRRFGHRHAGSMPRRAEGTPSAINP